MYVFLGLVWVAPTPALRLEVTLRPGVARRCSLMWVYVTPVCQGGRSLSNCDSSDDEWLPPSGHSKAQPALPLDLASSSADAPEFQELYRGEIPVGCYVVVHITDDDGSSGIDVGKVTDPNHHG